MKKLLIILVAIIVSNVAISQDAEYSQRLINRAEKIKNQSIMYKTYNHNKHGCLTMVLKEAKKNWHKLTNEAQEYFKTATTRPTLSGTEQIFYSDYFDIHYTLSGADAIDATDSDANGDPDYVEIIALILDEVYEEDSITHKYTMPPSDKSKGGSGFYDVYIYNIGKGLYGAVAPEDSVGDNPNSTTHTEISAFTSWMELNNDYTWAKKSLDTAIMVTVAHEFFHAIQNGYTTDNTDFIDEATAAWMEEVIYPGFDDNFQYLPEIFDYPDVALNWNSEDQTTAEEYDGHWYAGWVFFKYLEEQTSTDIVRKIYERCITDDEIDAIDNELKAKWNSSFDEIFENWLIANVIMDSDNSYTPYTYSRASDYENYLDTNTIDAGIKYESSFDYSGTPIVYFSDIGGNERLMRLSADYFEVTANQNFSIILTPDDSLADIDIILLKLNSTNLSFDEQYSDFIDNEYVITVSDQSLYDTYVLIIIRYDSDVSDTLSEQYALSIVNEITGLNSINKQNEYINIYPNPVVDNITIDYLSEMKNINIEITDILSKIIYQSGNIVTNDKYSINARNWNKGIYFISVRNDKQVVKNEKIIIIE